MGVDALERRVQALSDQVAGMEKRRSGTPWQLAEREIHIVSYSVFFPYVFLHVWGCGMPCFCLVVEAQTACQITLTQNASDARNHPPSNLLTIDGTHTIGSLK